MLSMWKRSPLILVTNFHKSFRLNICLLENRNLCTPLQTLNSKTRLSPTHTSYIILNLYYILYRFHNSLYGGVNFWLGAFRVLRDRFLFRVFSNRIPFRGFFRVFSDRVLLRVLSDSILFRVLSPHFLACRAPSVAWTTWGILQYFQF